MCAVFRNAALYSGGPTFRSETGFLSEVFRGFPHCRRQMLVLSHDSKSWFRYVFRYTCGLFLVPPSLINFASVMLTVKFHSVYR
jgi:hypothetical protein